MFTKHDGTALGLPWSVTLAPLNFSGRTQGCMLFGDCPRGLPRRTSLNAPLGRKVLAYMRFIAVPPTILTVPQDRICLSSAIHRSRKEISNVPYNGSISFSSHSKSKTAARRLEKVDSQSVPGWRIEEYTEYAATTRSRWADLASRDIRVRRLSTSSVVDLLLLETASSRRSSQL